MKKIVKYLGQLYKKFTKLKKLSELPYHQFILSLIKGITEQKRFEVE